MMRCLILLLVLGASLAGCGAGPGFGCKKVTPTGYCSDHAP
jgi:hypothetical protein